MHIECKCIANQSEITEPNCFTPRFASVYANGKSFSERKKNQQTFASVTLYL